MKVLMKIESISLYQRIVGCGLSISCFTFFALSLCVHSGYSYGAAGCVLFSLAGLVLCRKQTWTTELKALCAVVVLMGLVWGLSFDGWWSWTGSDYLPKYWLAALCLAVAYQVGVQVGSVVWGVALGAAGALGIASYQYLVLGWSKATGYTNAIEYGGIAMYLGIATWAMALFGSRPRWQALLLWLLGGCGVLASLLSEARGAWVVAPLLMAVVLSLMWHHGKQRLVLWTVVGAVLCVAAMVIPAIGKFETRVGQSVAEVQLYWKNPQQGAVTSAGQRLEQWRLALRMGAQHPLTGWGVSGVVTQKQKMVAAGLAHPSVLELGHAHNEILDMWAKRGLVGVIVLLAFYAIPLGVMWPTSTRLARVPQAQRASLVAVRVAASLLPIAYFGFGWTQVFFAHNSGNLFYIFSLVAFMGCIRRLEIPAERAALFGTPERWDPQTRCKRSTKHAPDAASLRPSP